MDGNRTDEKKADANIRIGKTSCNFSVIFCTFSIHAFIAVLAAYYITCNHVLMAYYLRPHKSELQKDKGSVVKLKALLHY